MRFCTEKFERKVIVDRARSLEGRSHFPCLYSVTIMRPYIHPINALHVMVLVLDLSSDQVVEFH